jgi:hypothetical protein
MTQPLQKWPFSSVYRVQAKVLSTTRTWRPRTGTSAKTIFVTQKAAINAAGTAARGSAGRDPRSPSTTPIRRLQIVFHLFKSHTNSAHAQWPTTLNPNWQGLASKRNAGREGIARVPDAALYVTQQQIAAAQFH